MIGLSVTPFQYGIKSSRHVHECETFEGSSRSSRTSSRWLRKRKRLSDLSKKNFKYALKKHNQACGKCMTYKDRTAKMRKSMKSLPKNSLDKVSYNPSCERHCSHGFTHAYLHFLLLLCFEIVAIIIAAETPSISLSNAKLQNLSVECKF